MRSHRRKQPQESSPSNCSDKFERNKEYSKREEMHANNYNKYTPFDTNSQDKWS